MVRNLVDVSYRSIPQHGYFPREPASVTEDCPFCHQRYSVQKDHCASLGQEVIRLWTRQRERLLVLLDTARTGADDLSQFQRVRYDRKIF